MNHWGERDQMSRRQGGEWDGPPYADGTRGVVCVGVCGSCVYSCVYSCVCWLCVCKLCVNVLCNLLCNPLCNFCVFPGIQDTPANRVWNK